MAISRRLMPQPLTSIALSVLACITVVASLAEHSLSDLSTSVGQPLVVALCLMLAVIIADHLPIHIRLRTKVSVTTVPLYLLAVFLEPGFAALAAGVSVLIFELLQRTQRGSLPTDIATSASRWILVAWIGSSLGHTLFGTLYPVAALALIAIVMFIGDFLTAVLAIAPITGEPPLQVLRASFHEGGLIEGVQYLIGILGAMAAIGSWWALLLLLIPIGIVYIAFKNVKELRDSTQQLLEGMADAVDLRDPYTGGHSRRVTELCRSILNELDLVGVEAALIIAAARLHDIGKIAVPDSILTKPDKLTSAEWAIMETHAARGAELLMRYPDFARGADIVRHHHERWDGKGYPDRLAGYAIPIGARVIAVADTFDAMTSDRPYRRGLTTDVAAEVLRNDRGKQWDPEIVQAFLRSMEGQLALADCYPVPSLSLPGQQRERLSGV